MLPNSNRAMTNYNSNPANAKINYNEVNTNLMCKPSTTSIGTVLSNGTTTASQFTADFNDEEVGLIRRRSTGSSKKKSGLLRTLFRFGSKKFKDKEKQVKATATSGSNVKKELEEEVEKIRARKAALYEQERIQEYYRRLLDQQKFNESVQHQTQQQQQQMPHLQQLHQPVQSKVYQHNSLTKTSTMPTTSTRPSVDSGLYGVPKAFDRSGHPESANRLRNTYQTEAGLRVIENTQVNCLFFLHFCSHANLFIHLLKRSVG
jgi:hypothetical protein